VQVVPSFLSLSSSLVVLSVRFIGICRHVRLFEFFGIVNFTVRNHNGGLKRVFSYKVKIVCDIKVDESTVTIRSTAFL
jgi:hypothetical protein